MTRARTYITVIQAPEGYSADSELRKLEETPAPPVVHAVVLLDDHEKLEAEVERLRQALAELAGDYGCTTIEPLDPAFPPTGDPCRDRRPDQPETWCYACHATVALTGGRSS